MKASKPSIITEILPNGVSFDMLLVERGRFLMGKGIEEYEKQSHWVDIAKDYYIGKFPVTQEVWEAVMGEGNNPSGFKGKKRPVEGVSWRNITNGFLPKLNEMTGQTYFLPSEAQWEFAARGGNKSKGFLYAGSNKLKEVGWYRKNSHWESKEVGLKNPNELGIFDMSGNVWEWCQDVWERDYKSTPIDGTARQYEEKKHLHVVRGGSWYYFTDNCRVTYHYRYYDFNHNPNIGFRLTRY